MTTHFITVEIDIQETPTLMHQVIEAELKKQGEPLRWAVTSVDVGRQKALVEAVVTLATDAVNAAPAVLRRFEFVDTFVSA